MRDTYMGVNEINTYFTLFLCGDVMIGRGIDQILLHPSGPQLYESYVKDARDYIRLAERLNGKIPYPVAPDYIWGDALAIWETFKPVVKIINLETAITQSGEKHSTMQVFNFLVQVKIYKMQ